MEKTELITQPELMEWSGFKQRTGLIQWLTDNRIPFFFGKGGVIVTTISAINSPLVGQEVIKKKPRLRK